MHKPDSIALRASCLCVHAAQGCYGISVDSIVSPKMKTLKLHSSIHSYQNYTERYLFQPGCHDNVIMVQYNTCNHSSHVSSLLHVHVLVQFYKHL